MIKRNAARYTKNQESLQQSSFTAMRGIDSSKAPTQPDTILNAVNLDVDYDGGLVLRKPLLFKENHSDKGIVNVFTMFDKVTKIKVFSNTLTLCDTEPISLQKYIFTDIYGVRHTIDNFTTNYCCDFANCKIVNTANTTLVSNVMVKLNHIYDTYNIEVYNSNTEPIEQPRIFKIYKEDSWVLEMLTPEMNFITNSDIAVDFNTTLNNVYAIRDNYNAPLADLKGIVAYLVEGHTKESAHSYNYTYNPQEGVRTFNFRITPYPINDETNTIEVDGALGTLGQVSYIRCTVGDNHIFKDITVTVRKERGGNIVTSKSFEIFDNVADEFILDLEKYMLVDSTFFTISCTFKGISLEDVSVDCLTESNQVKIIDSLKPEEVAQFVVLKAFIDRPTGNIKYVGAGDKDVEYSVLLKWEYSTDGITWNPITAYVDTDWVQIPVIKIADKLPGLEDSKSLTFESEYYTQLPNIPFEDRYLDMVSTRTDCLCIVVSKHNLKNAYRCTLIKVKKIPPAYEYEGDAKYMVDYVLSEKSYTFKESGFNSSEDLFKNPITGNMLYWKHALYSVSPEFKNNIYTSNPDSAIFPISRIIDLGTFEGNTVRKLIPWRDYLIAFTDSTVHLIQEQEVGFTSKVINTFVGTPERDANTCVATLNGIVFKSGSKMYSIVPNVNSGDETIFNVSEISKPIEHILERLEYNDTYNPFAFTTAEAYYLFVPGKVDTFCLKYNYTMRVWTQFKYPVLLYKHEMLSVDDIRVFAKDGSEIIEYEFEKEPSDIYELQTYGDFLTTEKDENDVNDPNDNTYKIKPIEFFVDSGQKCDNLHLTKQFVESKIIVATLSNKDNFEMDVQIAVEGSMFNKHIDVNTDGALLRGDSNQVLTLGTTTDLSGDEDVFNTMRQIFIRYSGRGKTIRHIIKGKSLYKFKIYETFYRYKILNVKQ